MTELQVAVVRWLAYSRAQPAVDPRVLYKLLVVLENTWPKEVLSREEVQYQPRTKQIIYYVLYNTVCPHVELFT